VVIFGVSPFTVFRDRTDAGRQLADELLHYGGRDGVIILALPRGGVPVAAEVANRLALPLDVFVVRKLGVPGHEELAMGAIASGDVRVLNHDVINAISVPDEIIETVTAVEYEELRRRERSYRGERPAPDVHGRTVILVDDGLATGASMRAAVAALRQKGAARIVVAVPVGAPSTCHELEQGADEVICLTTPYAFVGVGQYYEDFSQTSDEEVRDLLERASK
jgi:putative phosphoribosyl transferase